MTEKAECVLWTVIKKSVSRNKRGTNILHQKTPACVTKDPRTGQREPHMKPERVLRATDLNEHVKIDPHVRMRQKRPTHTECATQERDPHTQNVKRPVCHILCVWVSSHSVCVGLFTFCVCVSLHILCVCVSSHSVCVGLRDS